MGTNYEFADYGQQRTVVRIFAMSLILLLNTACAQQTIYFMGHGQAGRGYSFDALRVRLLSAPKK